jgi:hypothetical protein
MDQHCSPSLTSRPIVSRLISAPRTVGSLAGGAVIGPTNKIGTDVHRGRYCASRRPQATHVAMDGGHGRRPELVRVPGRRPAHPADGHSDLRAAGIPASVRTSEAPDGVASDGDQRPVRVFGQRCAGCRGVQVPTTPRQWVPEVCNLAEHRQLVAAHGELTTRQHDDADADSPLALSAPVGGGGRGDRVRS